ncbi:MAG TPA: TlpA disulfide reductase family protein [Mycobacteriales bacterium]|nr:TlpA disulfide reductase family protein [Mycobacteriales bacterium]
MTGRLAARGLSGAAMLAVAACGTAAAPGPTTGPAVAAADLARCPPATSSGSIAGGLPALSLRCLGVGPGVDLAGLRGTPTVLNLWASWCGPCQAEVPVLESVYRDAGSRLRVLGVDVMDGGGAALSFAAAAGMTYPSVVDPGGESLHRLGLIGLPDTAFVTAAGRLVDIHVGPYGSRQQFAADIHRYLGISLPLAKR